VRICLRKQGERRKQQDDQDSLAHRFSQNFQ